MTKDKPKFDKNKCLKCKYHGERTMNGWGVRKYGKMVPIFCDYSCLNV